MQKIINPYQTGFLNDRFIGDNGMLVHLILQQTRYQNHPGIGLLLDQEKAYDRVHAGYLTQVLRAFGFPLSLIDVNQKRGLRQGDPLSPILFNLALEPLLLSIFQDPLYQGYSSSNSSSNQQIKCLAYADDICVFVHDQNDFVRLQTHLNNYAKVSNAIFNQHKTEAFSLSGDTVSSWSTLLRQHRIDTYYSKSSPTTLRYLGFYMPYTSTQRNFVQDMLLDKVQTLIYVFSQRRLSLRGCAMIANTLILSQLWFCLRLFHPTQAFLDQIRRLIYKSVWQEKYPKVSFDQLCLPRLQGGVGLLNPVRQHLVLQMKWLFALFDRNQGNTLLKSALSHHLLFMSTSSSFPTLPFFSPVLRKHDLCHQFSIIPVMFQTFDHFGIDFNLQRVPIQTLLHFPLIGMFSDLPSGHWLYRHTELPAMIFFKFDENTHRLRLQVRTEYSKSPLLCRSLYNDILIRHCVQLQTFLIPYIYNEVEQVNVEENDQSLVSQLHDSPLYSQYTSKAYRMHNYSSASNTQLNLPSKLLCLFWSSSMPLPSRALWFRVINKKLPTEAQLYKINRVPSSNCRLCSSSIDSFEHFILYCPWKWTIWNEVLTYFYPQMYFSADTVYRLLCLESCPPA